MKTLSKVRQGRLLQEICDYIFGTGQRCFDMVEIRDTRNYSSEHFALWDRLLHPEQQCDVGVLPDPIQDVHGVRKDTIS